MSAVYLARLIRAAHDLAEFDRMIADGRAAVDWSRCIEAVEVYDEGAHRDLALSCYQQRDRDGGSDLSEDFFATKDAPTVCAGCAENRDIYKRIRELKVKRELAVKRVIRNGRHVPQQRIA